MRHVVVYTILLFLLVSGSPVPADQITLSNGRTIEGRVLSESEDYVRVETGGFVTRLDRSSVTNIVKAPEFENTLLAAEAALKRRDPVNGIQLLFQAREQGAPDERLQDVLQRLNGGITGAITRSTPDERSNIRRSLRAMMDKDMLTSRTLFLTSQNFFQLQDWESTSQALGQIAPADINRDPVMRHWALDIMRQLVRRRLARDDFEGAIAVVEKMRRITGGESNPNLPLANMARAAAAREVHDYASAFEIIAKDLNPEVPEIARNRATYTAGSLEAWATSTRKFTEARKALEPIRDIYPVLYTTVRARLVEKEGKALLDDGMAPEALALLDSVPEESRSEELRRLYKQAWHEDQLARIGDSDPLRLLKHGQWCAENGLLDEAISIFNHTRENPNLKELSDQFLVNTRRTRDTKLLEEAQKHYDEGLLTEALDRTQRILTNPNLGSQLQEEAQKLNDLAKASMNREAESRGPRAEVFYQRADRAYILENYDESLSLLNLILKDYADTPAAHRAADLLPYVVQSLELSYLEGKRKALPALPPRISLKDTQDADDLNAEIKDLLKAMEAEPDAGS